MDVSGDTVLAASVSVVMLSSDGGNTWSELRLPNLVTRIYQVALGPDSEAWIVTPMGAFRTKDAGEKWEHVMVGQPFTNFTYIRWDHPNARLIAVAAGKKDIFESYDGGDTWKLAGTSHWPIRNVSISSGRMLAVTEFNGVVAQPETSDVKAAGGGN